MHAKTCLRPSWRALQLLTLASIVLCVIVLYAVTWESEEGVLKFLPAAIQRIPRPTFPSLTDVGKGISSGLGVSGETLAAAHPIEQLMKAAEKRLEVLLKTQATSLEDAAAKYRKKRGRHPPPGFDAWYAFASEKGAVIVEEFWNQIYHDLGPFWGVEPSGLRQRAHGFHPKISIRDGTVMVTTIVGHVRLGQWTDMLETLASYLHVHLPDVDIPINVNNEPAMLVPWETIDTALSMARPILLPLNEILNEHSSLKESDAENHTFTFDPEWLGPRLTHPSNAILGPRPFWSLVRPACPSHSPARLSPTYNDIWHPQGHVSAEHSAASLLPSGFPNCTLMGYVSNWTIATDACEYPDLQGLHGAFVKPGGMSATTSLFPLFGASKMSISNEILLPSPSDWNCSTYSPSDPLAWELKENKLTWHGPAIGGHNTGSNWRRFHRHRFVSMLNATQLEVAEAMLHAGNESTVGLAPSGNFRLLPANEYNLETLTWGRMAEWVVSWANVEFTDLKCDQDWGGVLGKGCEYNGEYYSVPAADEDQNKEVQEKGQRLYKYTAVVDGDGGDSNDTFISYLNTGTVVLKASVYKQWYDARLVPWLHFVPMDNTFVDLYGIMEFFLGSQTTASSADYAHLKVEAPTHEHHFHDTNNEINKRDRDRNRGGRVKKRGGDDDGHDAHAERIANAGKDWSEKVLRREDMLIYVYRLTLEYARVLDDKRAAMGWVGDLLDEEG